MAITKQEWLEIIRDVFQDLAEKERQRLGPVEQLETETIIAYVKGELSNEEEDRVREFIYAYPELADVVLDAHRAINTPF